MIRDSFPLAWRVHVGVKEGFVSGVQKVSEWNRKFHIHWPKDAKRLSEKVWRHQGARSPDFMDWPHSPFFFWSPSSAHAMLVPTFDESVYSKYSKCLVQIGHHYDSWKDFVILEPGCVKLQVFSSKSVVRRVRLLRAPRFRPALVRVVHPGSSSEDAAIEKLRVQTLSAPDCTPIFCNRLHEFLPYACLGTPQTCSAK